MKKRRGGARGGRVGLRTSGAQLERPGLRGGIKETAAVRRIPYRIEAGGYGKTGETAAGEQIELPDHAGHREGSLDAR